MGRLGDSIQQFLGKKQRDKGQRSSLAPAAKRAAKVPPDPKLKGEERLKAVLSQKELISAGRLQILGLDKIRERFGDRWETVADRVDAIVQATINKRLTPVDVFVRYGDSNYPAYVILFSQLKTEEAKIKCAILSEEIARQVFGDEEARDFVEVKTVVATVDGQLLVKEVNPLDVIGGLFDSEAKMEQAAESANRTNEKPSRRTEAWQEGGLRDSLPDDLEFTYQPVWDVRRNAILTFRCLAEHKGASNNFTTSYDVLGTSRPAHDLVADLDILILRRAKRDLHDLQQSGRRLLLACCVHFMTLARPVSRQTYHQICQAMPQQLRRNLVLEIVGIPEDVAQVRLLDLILPLRQPCRAVHAYAGLNANRFGNFRNTGIDAIGVDIGHSPGPEAHLIAKMDPFVMRANGAGLRTFISGLKSKSLAIAAVGAGFDYIDGCAVYSTVSTPAEAYRFKPTDLFGDLLSQGRSVPSDTR